MDLNKPIDSLNNTLLHLAVNASHLEATRILLSQKADPKIQNLKGDTPFHKATENGHLTSGLPIVALLLAHGASPKQKNHLGKTPLQTVTNIDAAVFVSVFSSRNLSYQAADLSVVSFIEDYAKENEIPLVKLSLVAFLCV